MLENRALCMIKKILLTGCDIVEQSSNGPNSPCRIRDRTFKHWTNRSNYMHKMFYPTLQGIITRGQKINY